MLHNLSSIDLEEPREKKPRYRGKSMGLYEAERLIGRRHNGEVIYVYKILHSDRVAYE